MASKTKYRIRNWKDYNKSLIQRGSITVWFSQDAIDKWHAAPEGKRGRPFTYSDDAILTALLIRFVFHLPLRALEGFLCSLVSFMGLCLCTPSLGGQDEGRKLWKNLKGYHRRSLAETGMYRFKTLFGPNLTSRTMQRQQCEVYIKGRALNIMTCLGMPQSEKSAI